MENIEIEKEDPKNMNGQTEVTAEKVKVLQRHFSPLFLIIFAVLIIGFGTISLAMTFNYLPNPFNKKEDNKKVVSSTKTLPDPTSLPINEGTSSAQKVNKDNYKIQILNGSGIAGQAGKIASALKEIGFINIVTGNFGGEDQTETTIYYKGNISSKLLDEVEIVLKKNLNDLNFESTRSGEFDIVIITGD